MLRVGFDDQIFEAQLRGGVSLAFVELITRLPAHGIEPVVLARATRNRHLAESGLVPAAAPRGALSRSAHWVAWRLAGSPEVTPDRPVDVLHHTFTHPRYLGRWSGPRVTTIHDMTPELFPELFPLGNPHFAKRLYAERSEGIVSVSQNTADDLLRLYGEHLRPRIEVIPHGVAARFLAADGPELPVPEHYLLYVGMRGGYKRFDLALATFAQIAREDAGLRFLVVGGGAFDRRERAAVRASGVGDRVEQVFPSDAEMPGVYRRAAAFVFPSGYEGFGLPTLEALASGTPTVLADVSSSREIGGDAASYFPPGDGAALTVAVREAMSPAAHQRTARSGPARAALFDWDATAARHADLYRRLAQPSS